MDFNQRLELALAQVSKTGIWQSNYVPPIYHCLWFAGVEVPPPHFASFTFNAVFSGAWFGACWAAVMWLMCWSHAGIPGLLAVAFATVVGACFGLTMAAYYLIGAWHYDLPRWNTIGGACS